MSKTIAIMQPYLFAYLGYYQLINAVDEFYFLDDVNYIKRGWSNRNYILLDGKKHRFTIPVKGASQNKKYKDIEVVDGWYAAYKKLINTAYNVDMWTVLDLWGEECKTFCAVAQQAMMWAMGEPLAGTDFQSWVSSGVKKFTSKLDYEPATGQQRIINICKAVGATRYVNPIGGRDLYDKAAFEAEGIELCFLKTHFKPYPQRKVKEFVPGLSILDIIFNCTPEQVREQLDNYEIITA